MLTETIEQKSEERGAWKRKKGGRNAIQPGEDLVVRSFEAWI